MKCSFCLTATMGFTRNLSPSEIVNQVCAVGDFLRNEPKSKRMGPDRVTNLVFMGMGEPLNNLDNLIKSISILTEQRGLDMTNRRITVSTCGIVHNMLELGEKTDVNLAISLHAVDDSTRDSLMPVNNRYPLTELLQACRDYPLAKRKRIMFEYILLKGINDSDEDAHKLGVLLRDIPCKINLLPYNESPGLPFKSPSRNRVYAFQKLVRDAGYSVFIRTSRGDDISAACGQLAKQTKTRNPMPELEACTGYKYLRETAYDRKTIKQAQRPAIAEAKTFKSYPDAKKSRIASRLESKRSTYYPSASKTGVLFVNI